MRPYDLDDPIVNLYATAPTSRRRAFDRLQTVIYKTLRRRDDNDYTAINGVRLSTPVACFYRVVGDIKLLYVIITYLTAISKRLKVSKSRTDQLTTLQLQTISRSIRDFNKITLNW